MITFLTVLHICVCLFLILVVLLQAGKGGGMGIAFGGSGGSQTVFGSSGAGNFLTRLTSITATIFLITSLGLAHFSSQQDSKRLQRLAELKATEKRSDEERANKLKVELDKARSAVEKSTAPAPLTTIPVPATKLTAPFTTPAPSGAGDKTTAKLGNQAAPQGAAKTPVAGSPAVTGADKPAAPTPAPKKRRVLKTEDAPAAGAPAGEGAPTPATAPVAPPPAP
jgi:preprotein translocase subunit SecG